MNLNKRIEVLENRRPDKLPTVDVEIHQGQDQQERPERYEKQYSHSVTGYNGQRHDFFRYVLRKPKLAKCE